MTALLGRLQPPAAATAATAHGHLPRSYFPRITTISQFGCRLVTASQTAVPNLVGMSTHKKRPLLHMMLIVWGLVPTDEPSPRVLLER